MITLEAEGRRLYFIGNTYPIKDKLRRLGATWDADRKAWWIGSTKRAEAEQLVSQVASEPTQTEMRRDETLKDSDSIAGRATYKGKNYILVWEGETRRGQGFKLAMNDGSKVFWAQQGEPVTVTKRYQTDRDGNSMTFGRLKHLRKKYAEEIQSEQDGTAETKTCWECGREFTFRQCREADGDWSNSYCGC